MKNRSFIFLAIGLMLFLFLSASGCTQSAGPIKPLAAEDLSKNNASQDTGLDISQQQSVSLPEKIPDIKNNNSEPETFPSELMGIPESTENNCVGFLIGSKQEMKSIQLVGAGFARPHPGPFVWGFIEKQKGEFDFSDTDNYVKSSQENEIAILATIWPFADWDQDASCKVSDKDTFSSKWPGGEWAIPQYRCKPKDMGAYKSFLNKLVERYDGDGKDDMSGLKMPIKYWEVLNEPELKSEQLTFFLGDEKDYFEILKASYATIKETCADCKVVQAGCAGTQDEFLSFWDNVFALGAGNYFDIANIHYISGPDSSTLNTKDFKKLLDKYSLNKPIWVTEAEFKDSNAEVKSSVKGAFDNGAEKIFFVSFNVGGHSLSKPGEYAQVYKEIAGSCPGKPSNEQEIPSYKKKEDLEFTVTEDSGTRVSGSVPYALKLNNGKIRLYYCENGISSAISEDGLKFTTEGSIGIEGCDPTIVRLSDEKVRMYYKESSGPGGPGQAIHKVYSATSEDGIIFKKEGLVIDSEKTGDGGWASVPEAIKMPDGRVRIYYVSADPEALGGIMSATSSDGITFEKDKDVRIKAAYVDPAITILPDGRYWLLIIYHCIDPKMGCSTSEDGVYSHVSEDGLVFTNKQLLYQSTAAFDPSILELGNNSYRIYYGSMGSGGLVNTKSIVVKIAQ